MKYIKEYKEENNDINYSEDDFNIIIKGIRKFRKIKVETLDDKALVLRFLHSTNAEEGTKYYVKLHIFNKEKSHAFGICISTYEYSNRNGYESIDGLYITEYFPTPNILVNLFKPEIFDDCVEDGNITEGVTEELVKLESESEQWAKDVFPILRKNPMIFVGLKKLGINNKELNTLFKHLDRADEFGFFDTIKK